MTKTLIGSQLRQLRRLHRQTQADMAQRLGISPAYVNLLENNQRSLSVQVLMALTEAYGVDWRDLVRDTDAGTLTDLRTAVRDPMFPGDPPDLTELRAALDHTPRLAEMFLHLFQSHRAMLDRYSRLGGMGGLPELLATSPETAIHDFFRDNSKHFPALESLAEQMRRDLDCGPDDLYGTLKARLWTRHGLRVVLRRISDMPDTLRLVDRENSLVALSEALDHPNRVFQLAHVAAALEGDVLLDELIRTSGIAADTGQARLRVELANYAAAAMLMPYAQVLHLAERTQYDVDHIAASFGVSFEQVCHRLTTLQREGARGVPFFFLRIDKAGNVTKRFNATPFTLAEQGGACPVWNIHDAFRAPGVILPQFVDLPDGGKFFTISRTTDRPVFNRRTQDRRLVVALGCEKAHVGRIGYAAPFDLSQPDLSAPIGINCHLCPRQACSQRAHQPLVVHLPVDTDRRGNTRYES